MMKGKEMFARLSPFAVTAVIAGLTCCLLPAQAQPTTTPATTSSNNSGCDSGCRVQHPLQYA